MTRSSKWLRRVLKLLSLEASFESTLLEVPVLSIEPSILAQGRFRRSGPRFNLSIWSGALI